jgi:hypothetical protein
MFFIGKVLAILSLLHRERIFLQVFESVFAVLISYDVAFLRENVAFYTKYI